MQPLKTKKLHLKKSQSHNHTFFPDSTIVAYKNSQKHTKSKLTIERKKKTPENKKFVEEEISEESLHIKMNKTKKIIYLRKI